MLQLFRAYQGKLECKNITMIKNMGFGENMT